MGTTAEKIARTIGLQAKSPVIDLASHRTARQLLRDARVEGDEIKKLISEGYDPSHAVYIYAQNLTSVLAEQLSTTKEARQYAKVVGDTQDIYMPSYPLMSPLTTSYFNMWAFFDVLFGQSHETRGWPNSWQLDARAIDSIRRDVSAVRVARRAKTDTEAVDQRQHC